MENTWVYLLFYSLLVVFYIIIIIYIKSDRLKDKIDILKMELNYTEKHIEEIQTEIKSLNYLKRKIELLEWQKEYIEDDFFYAKNVISELMNYLELEVYQPRKKMVIRKKEKND